MSKPKLKSNKEQSPLRQLRSAEFFSVQAVANLAETRRETYNNVEHLVVPMVILVEGVLWPSNAEGPELALAEEFGRFPDGWNGRPVVLGHPVLNGAAVSANSPSIMEEYAFGFLFNTQLKDTKLRSEAWINLGRVDELGEDFQTVIERFETSTELVEVSTGLFSMNEDAAGDFNGEEYTAIWRNIVPDHLAILPEGVKGACSVEDGCGAPRISGAAFFPESPGSGTFLLHKQNQNSMEATMPKAQCKCQGDHVCDGCKPGASPSTSDTPGDVHTQEGIFKSLISRFGEMLSFRSNQNELSDRDTRTALDVALTEMTDDYHYIIAVFEDFFIYEKGYEYTLLRRGYDISEGGVVTLMDDAIKVRPVTTFVPLETATSTSTSEPTTSATAEEATMDKTKVIEALISNKGTPFDATDKKYLTGLDETKLSALTAKFDAPVDNKGDETTDTQVATNKGKTDEVVEGKTTETSVAQPQVPATLDEYIQAAPAEMREVLRSSHTLHQKQRTDLITHITANARNKFSEEQLKDMSTDVLENLATLAGHVVDYSGVGAGNLRNQGVDEDTKIPEPPKLFAVNNEQK